MNGQKSVLSPRNGKKLNVLIVARISGGPTQKEQSLADQADHGRAAIADLYTGPADYIVIATTGKGEKLDRPELEEVRAHIRSGKIDVLFAEDAGRIVRGTAAKDIACLAVDHKVRVLIPNDDIDSEDPNWETDMIDACKEHVGANESTSKRLKKKLMNRFVKGLGAIPRETYGYIVPENATRYDQWLKDTAATAIFEEWFDKLKAGAEYCEIARWLNKLGIKPGPYCRRKTWNGKAVARVTRNAILKGHAGRGFRHTVKRHGTGGRISEINPAGPNWVVYPHLVHIEPALWDEVNSIMTVRNAGMGRKKISGCDPRAGVPRSDTTWPAQHILCGICGRPFYRGGHGQKDHLMCSGARDHLCWVGTSFNGALAAEKIISALLEAVESMPDFDEVLMTKLEAEAAADDSDRGERYKEATAQLAKVERAIGHYTDTIGQMGSSAAIREKLTMAEHDKMLLKRQCRDLSTTRTAPLTLPSIDILKANARTLLGAADFGDVDFRRELKELLPKIEVFPCRLLDGGAIRLRAHVTIQLAALLPDHRYPLGILPARRVVVDLFDRPQRAAFGELVVALRASGMTEKAVAEKLGLTIPAAQRAKTLQERSVAEGHSDQYVYLGEPPKECRKKARHLNESYRFEPLPGYPAVPCATEPNE